MKKSTIYTAVLAGILFAGFAGAAVEMPPSAVEASGSQTNGVIIVSPGGNSPGGEQGWHLFNPSSKWLVRQKTAWIVYQFANGDSWALTNYVIVSANDAHDRDPRSWRVEGSNDLQGNTAADVGNATWTTVHEHTAFAPFDAFDKAYEFSCADNRVPYKAYRLNVLLNWGAADLMQIGRWMMNGVDGAAWIIDASATDSTSSSANIAGTLETYKGSSYSLTAFCAASDFGTDLAAWQGGHSATAALQAPVPDGAFAIGLSGLDAGMPYVARVFAKDGDFEGWSAPIYFATYSDSPEVATLAPANVTPTSAVARASLVFAGGVFPEAEVILHWGAADAGEGAWQHSVPLGLREPGDEAVFLLEGLNYGTQYHYRHQATNAAASAWAAQGVSFTTPGLPVFGAPSAALFSNRIVAGVELLDVGAGGIADVAFWFGESESGMAQVAAWSGVDAARAFEFATNVAPGTVYYGKFTAVSTMPDAVSPTVAATPVFTAEAGNDRLIWDNAHNNNAWDFTTSNWHIPGNANGSDVFKSGASVEFSGPYAANASSPELRHDIAVDDMNVAIAQNNQTWTLAGGRTLSVYGALAITSPNLGNAVIDEPRIAGLGGLVLDGAKLRLGNNANSFSGPLNLLGGELTAVSAQNGATVLGAGEVRLGAGGAVSSLARLNLNSAGGAAANTIAAAGLVITGGSNAARIVLDASDDSAGGIHATFASLAHDPGASLSVRATRNFAQNPGGANEKIFFAEPPASPNLPPWAVLERDGGYYLAYDSVNGLVRRELTQTAFAAGGAGAGAGDFVRIASGTTLSGDAAAAAVQLQSNLDLGGNTLALGGGAGIADGAGGIMFKNTGLTLGNGTLDLGGGDLHVYSEHNGATLGASFANTASLRRFGSGNLSVTSPNLPPLVVSQHNNNEGTLHLNPAQSIVYGGQFRGPGAFRKDGEAQLEFAGNDAPLDLFVFDIYGGKISLSQGSSRVRTRMHLFNDGSLDIANATLDVAGQFIVGHNITPMDAACRILPGGALTASGMEIGGYGENNLLRIDGGACEITSTADNALRLGSHRYADTNRIEVVNSGRLDSAGSFQIGADSEGNSMLVSDGGAAVFNKLYVGYSASASNNVMRVANGGSIANGNTEVGANGRGNLMIIDNANVVNHSTANEAFRIGSNIASVSNRLEIINGGRYGCAGDARVGDNGSGNIMLVADGGVFAGAKSLHIGQTSSANNNALHLRPGGIATSATLNIGVAGNSGNRLLLAGGALEANTLNINGSGNILAVHLTSAGLPEVSVDIAGTATFAPGTLVVPASDSNAPDGKFVLLRAANPISDASRANITLAPGTDAKCWKLIITDHEVILRAAKSSTIILIR